LGPNKDIPPKLILAFFGLVIFIPLLQSTQMVLEFWHQLYSDGEGHVNLFTLLRGFTYSAFLSYLTATLLQLEEYWSLKNKAAGTANPAVAATTINTATASSRTMGPIELKNYQALNLMAFNIAHEINNPLAIISGQVNRIHKQIEREQFDKDKLFHLIHKIDNTLKRISYITNGLINFSSDGEEHPYQRESISKIIDHVYLLTLQSMKKKGISFRCRFEAETIDQTIDCKKVQIVQLLVNLITNSLEAIYHLPEAWIEISVSPHPSLSHALCLSLTDSGQGIPQEVVDKMTVPYFSTKKLGHSTGLGLSISQKIIDDHQGVLAIDNSHPHTRFLITLPCERQEKSPPESKNYFAA
jgi:signal transduction histidine kinase